MQSNIGTENGPLDLPAWWSSGASTRTGGIRGWSQKSDCKRLRENCKRTGHSKSGYSPEEFCSKG